MDIKKQRRFNERMGKRKSKGGLIRREGNLKYFDDGGTVLGGPSTSVVSSNPRTVNNNGLVGTIGNELGLNNQFQAGAANIQAGTNAAQLNNAYTGTQGALGQQQGVVNTLTPGITQGVGSQNTLTGMLTNQANGAGPNPAQMALNQATGQNVANQAALMAGQRGAGANVGLIARQAAQQGATTQQQAVGESATLQAQQQLAAEQNLQNLAAQQVGQGQQATTTLNEAQQNEQNILQGANTSFNNAGVAMQSNQNNVNAQIAAANQNQAGNIVGSIANAGSSVLSGLGGMFHAEGGEIHNSDLHIDEQRRQQFAQGGYTAPNNIAVSQTSGPTSYVGHFLTSTVNPGSGPNVGSTPSLPLPGEPTLYTGGKKPGNKGATQGELQSALDSTPVANQAGDPSANPNMRNAAKGGMMDKVPAMVSPGEIYLNPDQVKKVVHEGADPIKIGTHFKGNAKVKGDSLKNDTLSKDLDEGGVVVPRHISQMKGPGKSEKAELFVRRAVHMHSPKGGN